MTSIEQALFQSLVEGPLLVGDLPEASTFPHRDLSVPAAIDAGALNLQQKLGYLYESALAVLLEASPRFELLARNLQLQTDVHTTVGELDFLLRDLGDGNQLIHLELATKFYLAVPTCRGLTLPGPDARDNYFRKMRRLRGHQLSLARKQRELLPKQYREHQIVARQLIYGCLFDPILPAAAAKESVAPLAAGDPQASSDDRPGDASAPLVDPDFLKFLNPSRRRGRWLTIDQCRDHFAPDTEFRVIPKVLWPVPLEFIAGIALERWNPQLPVDRCVMLRVNDDTLPCFVAPSGYPEHQAR